VSQVLLDQPMFREMLDKRQGLTLVHFSALPKPFGHTSRCPPV